MHEIWTTMAADERQAPFRTIDHVQHAMPPATPSFTRNNRFYGRRQLEGKAHCHIRDPFGNRTELIKDAFWELADELSRITIRRWPPYRKGSSRRNLSHSLFLPRMLEERNMSIGRLAVVTLAAVIAFLCAPAILAASNSAGVTAAINHAVAAFNRGDMKSWAAACASPASIIDDFPPHAWNGSTACSDWVGAYSANTKQSGITGGMVTLGTPWHLTVTGDRGYAVYPATYTYKQHGKPMKEAGVFTMALQKSSARWLITAWAWADH